LVIETSLYYDARSEKRLINKILFCKKRMSQDCWRPAEIRTAYIFECFFQWLNTKTWMILRLGKHNFLLHAFALIIHRPPYHLRDAASIVTQCNKRKLQMARTF